MLLEGMFFYVYQGNDYEMCVDKIEMINLGVNEEMENYYIFSII